jgi:hypothetical protein
VSVGRECLTIGAEIEVVAHRALVTDSSYIPRNWFALAQGSITEDAIVNLVGLRRLGYSLIEWSKSMTRMGFLGTQEALRAIVPVRASEALVTHTDDTLQDVLAFI